MSRYSLKPLPEHSHIFEVAVGWDPGLGTFFVMVFGVADTGSDLDVRYWQGGKPNEIQTLQKLQNIVEPFGEITPELAQLLEADQHDRSANHSRQLSQFTAMLLGNSAN